MSDPQVELQRGLARGVIEKHEDGFDFYAFRGIPYGEKPVGELRFKDPVPIKKWTGTIDCKKYGPACLQYDPVFKFTSYSEDCLHLNVFTHAINDKSESNPVIFVIHGGAFMFGASDDTMYGPDYLMKKNVVIVTVSYRLGVLGKGQNNDVFGQYRHCTDDDMIAGFLNLEDEVAPGNLGLRDLLLALQWVQQNIRVFGGDPDNVTAFGLGSGSVLVHYLVLSPLSIGLIHKVILHSASAYGYWSRVKNAKSMAVKLCSILGKDLVDSKEILDFLKTVDAEQLLKAQESLRRSVDDLIISPGTDRQSPNPIMAVDIEIAANRGFHLPCIFLYTSHEAAILLHGISRKQFFENCDLKSGLVEKFHAMDLIRFYDLSEAQVRKLYYNNEKISEKNLDKYIDFSTDVYFVESIHRLARVQAEKSSAATYITVFSYNSPELPTKTILDDVKTGPALFDDIPFLFKMRALESMGRAYWKKGTREYKMMEQMVEMYTNFAKYGKPTVGTNELIPVHWQPIDDGTVIRYLNLDEEITMQTMTNLDQKFQSAKNL